MKFNSVLMLSFSMIFLSNCVPTGDFCDVYTSEIKLTRSTAEIAIQTDKEEIQKIVGRNTYWKSHCRK